MEYGRKIKVENFTDLEVWQEAHKLVILIYRVTKNFPQDEIFGLISQLRRCVISITSNIAEGFSRESIKEKIHFYSIARGSLTELINQLLIARDVNYLSSDNFDLLEKQYTSVHKLLNAFIKSTRIYRSPNSKFQIPNSNKGFTLIELLIAAAVMAILASVTVASFRENEKTKNLQATADAMVNHIRNGQLRALSSEAITGSSCAIASIPDRSPKSYILFFAATNIILYGVDKCDNAIGLETYAYPANIAVPSGGFALNGSSVTSLQIKFTPPFGQMAASTGPTVNQGTFSSFNSASAMILIGSKTKTITVDGISGKVE